MSPGVAGAEAADVVLECVHSAAVDVLALPKWRRCLARKLCVGSAWSIGPLQQPQTFCHLLPDSRVLQEEHWGHQHLFELAWQPPCLYLRKPTQDAPLLVNGTPVRQLTFVLLHGVEVSLGAGGGPALLAFRVLRGAGGPGRGPPRPAPAECALRGWGSELLLERQQHLQPTACAGHPAPPAA